MKSVEILDTTLRDGEQMEGVHYTPNQKHKIADFLLDELNVDKIEFCSALVSDEEKKSIKNYIKQRKDKDSSSIERITILAFANKQSVEWAKDVGVRIVNLLAKGSLPHITTQLKQTPEEHINHILNIIDHYHEEGIKTNIYLEDGSRGWKQTPELIKLFIKALAPNRILFPDTLGIFTPSDVFSLKKLASHYPLEFHAHNDYGLATANSVAAAQVGFKCIHATINGMGERAGNAPLEEVVIAINDLSSRKTNINESKLIDASLLIQCMSRKRVAFNKPIVGKNVFTQTAGVHADGDKKGNLYANNLTPERFGTVRRYAVGKLGGKSSIMMALKRFNLTPTKNQLKKLSDYIKTHKHITEADLVLVLNPEQHVFKIIDFQGLSTYNGSAAAMFKVRINNAIVEGASRGVGIFDAFMRGIKPILTEHNILCPEFKDYYVSVPPNVGSDAEVEVMAEWHYKTTFRTLGVDQDQTIASLKSIEKAINVANLLDTRNR